MPHPKEGEVLVKVYAVSLNVQTFIEKLKNGIKHSFWLVRRLAKSTGRVSFPHETFCDSWLRLCRQSYLYWLIYLEV
jgi:hypothetical protein